MWGANGKATDYEFPRPCTDEMVDAVKEVRSPASQPVACGYCVCEMVDAVKEVSLGSQPVAWGIVCDRCWTQSRM